MKAVLSGLDPELIKSGLRLTDPQYCKMELGEELSYFNAKVSINKALSLVIEGATKDVMFILGDMAEAEEWKPCRCCGQRSLLVDGDLCENCC